jgi:nucleoside-diphosphate kinase
VHFVLAFGAPDSTLDRCIAFILGAFRGNLRALFLRNSSFLLFYSLTFFGEIHMAVERTLSIIKPDAVAKNVIGQIYTRFESSGLKIIASRMAHLSRAEAEGFYAVHKGRPFFNDLVEFMTSGPVMIQALEGENAIANNRELMGATDPKKADAGTIRADFATSIDANAVHGSDAPETAAVEIAYFFPASQIFSR